MLPYWPQLLLFMGAMMLIALYGLTVSGHFPAEFRDETLKGGSGAIALWISIAVAVSAAGLTLLRGWETLPWYAVVIGAGAMLLFAPFCCVLCRTASSTAGAGWWYSAAALPFLRSCCGGHSSDAPIKSALTEVMPASSHTGERSRSRVPRRPTSRWTRPTENYSRPASR